MVAAAEAPHIIPSIVWETYPSKEELVEHANYFTCLELLRQVYFIKPHRHRNQDSAKAKQKWLMVTVKLGLDVRHLW